MSYFSDLAANGRSFVWGSAQIVKLWVHKTKHVYSKGISATSLLEEPQNHGLLSCVVLGQNSCQNIAKTKAFHQQTQMRPSFRLVIGTCSISVSQACQTRQAFASKGSAKEPVGCKCTHVPKEARLHVLTIPVHLSAFGS